MTCDRCGAPGATTYADDACDICDHVPLCDECRELHEEGEL